MGVARIFCHDAPHKISTLTVHLYMFYILHTHAEISPEGVGAKPPTSKMSIIFSAQTKIWLFMRCVMSIVSAYVASAGDASEKLNVSCKSAGYDTILLKYQGVVPPFPLLALMRTWGITRALAT